MTRGRAHLHRIERGLVSFQDLYILANGLNRAFSDLDFVHDPSGSLDSCQFTPVGEAILTGWATDLNAGGSLEGIQILSNGELVKTVTPSHDRPDLDAYFQRESALRSGWICHLGREQAQPESIIEIKLVNRKGKSVVISYDHLVSTLRRNVMAA